MDGISLCIPSFECYNFKIQKIIIAPFLHIEKKHIPYFCKMQRMCPTLILSMRSPQPPLGKIGLVNFIILKSNMDGIPLSIPSFKCYDLKIHKIILASFLFIGQKHIPYFPKSYSYNPLKKSKLVYEQSTMTIEWNLISQVYFFEVRHGWHSSMHPFFQMLQFENP